MRSTAHSPNFLYVGGSKCGSSWLFEILREHPQVFLPIAKDLKYFDYHSDRPIEWYLSCFEKAGDAVAIGEMSHDYFLFPQIAATIHGHFPHMKVIACLREPADRTLSRWLYARTTDLHPSIGFSEYARSAPILRENDYLANLRPYFDAFPREQILVLFYDDLVADPAAVARTLYRFLGVEENFAPPSLGKRVLPARQARSAAVGRFAYSFAQALRRFDGANLVGSVKRSSFFERLLYREIRRKPAIPAGDRAWIRARFAPDYDALGRLVGRTVPQDWV